MKKLMNKISKVGSGGSKDSRGSRGGGSSGNETATQRKRRLQKAKQKYQEKQASEDKETKRARLEQRRNRFQEETSEQREARLESMRQRIAEETQEQREARLQSMRQRNLTEIAQETQQQREARLEHDRLHHTQRLQALNADVATFNKAINNTFCDRICEICTKCCFPNQIYTVRYNAAALAYLPTQLSEKPTLLLCSRCRKHVTSIKTIGPSKAYWNNLQPGVIPEVITVLSQSEQRLASRVIPFVKIIKFTGLFGQYGFRGQAVLFAQDIFEVSERLPNMLPRSSNNAGIVVVTEHLQNLNITREFSISRTRVVAALRWLIANNPLYKDVRIDSNAEIDEQHLIRVVEPQEFEPASSNMDNNQPGEHASAYMPINEIARIVRASWHQANEEIFRSGYAGVQCCVMVLANIVRAATLAPYKWSTNTLNTNMLEADSMYETIRQLTPANEINDNGYLEVQHFNVIKNDFVMFNESFAIQYDVNTQLYGSLQDTINRGNIGMTLREGLHRLFINNTAGILIAASKSLGVMHYDDKYYFTDSHSCGPKGATAANGRACVIECDTIEELHRICRRATGSRNMQFTINFIDVRQKQDIINQPIHMEEPAVLQEALTAPIDTTPQELSICMQTSVMAPIDCVQPDVEDELEVSENVNEIHRKTRDNIVNEAHELKAEEFAWFYLFPYGINGLKENRPVHITPLDYYQFRILGSDTRFQRNDYLFYALSMFEYYRVQSTISACGKKVEGQDGKVEDLHLYMKNLRGSAAYWRTGLNDLIAQIKCLGPPKYFVTFSCNDLNWLDMRKALLIADGRPNEDPSTLNINATQRLIEQYPVIVSRHFMIRVNALMKFIKNNKDVFGGKVKDFWWRIEFQNRGSPHLHMVVWIEDHPPIDTTEGIRQVDQVCSCEIPPEDSELYELVKKCQMHRHTTTCKKNDTTSTTCRFNFPRQVCAETHIIDSTSDEFIRNGGRICLLKRRSQDRWVNNYNPILLSIWKGNMDIQPCGSNESIAHYIAKYISKSEPTDLDAGIRQAIRQIQREETDVSRKLFRICMRIMKERQISACECVYRLCHLNLRESSRKTVFVNTRKPNQRYKVLKFDETGQVSGYCANMFERYEKRPVQHADYDFNNMSLMEFAMLFEPYYARQLGDNEENIDEDAYEQHHGPTRRRLITLTDNSKMIIRNTPACIRVPHFVAATDPESYFYSLLLQYKPYRNENEILQDFNTAREAFLAQEQLLREMSEHMELFRQRDKQLENAFNQVHAFQIFEQAEPLELEEEEEAPDRLMDQAQFQSARQAMNVGQQEMFNMVTISIQSQLNGTDERLRIFFTGGAGVGKTFLLNLLKNQINRCYGKNAVKVCALTGVAARLIGGSTIHTTLKLPVQKDGRVTGMAPLTGNYLRVMRQQFREIEFMIIDEISMVSYQMLCMIDSRLRQLKNKDNEFFGGINVLFFGDLMQLPPIRRSGTAVYKQPEHFQPATHLWRLFTLCELTENMRQQGDNTFISLLNALRIGEMRPEHFAVLMGKVLQEPTGEFAVHKALRIYPTNKQVDDHNKAVLRYFKSKNMKMYTIRAQDQLVDATRNLGNMDISTIMPKDINKTGGLPTELEIFVGAKVMLRSNIDVTKGLVNGAIGHITEIIWPNFRRTQMYETDIPSVRIDFGRDGIHVIQPKSIQFPAKLSYGTAERRMLPLILSWASTVHKMQGCSVDNAVLYLGPQLFEEGQAYVALSRVRSLDGLRIEELDCSKITGKKPCNNEALAEMDRMRNHHQA